MSKRLRFWLARRLIWPELIAEDMLVHRWHVAAAKRVDERYWMGRRTAINRLWHAEYGEEPNA